MPALDIRVRDAIPALNEYLSSIQIDEDHPGILMDWQEDNLIAFIAAANSLNPVQVPTWLQTRPPQMTVTTFIDDIVTELELHAGGRCGHVLLAPNQLYQFLNVGITMVCMQNNDFLQNAAEIALPVVHGVERHLVETRYLTDTRLERSQPNNLMPAYHDGHPLHRRFR